MKCAGINQVKNTPLQQSSSLTFKRRLKEDEKPAYETDINEAFKYLGIKNRALIVHGSTYPDTKGNDRNHNVGSPYFSKEFNKFVKMNGFNYIQSGPNGELCKGDNSPYRASICSKNPIFMNFGKLKEENYGKLLDDDDISEVNGISEFSGKNYDYSDFDEAKTVSKLLIHKAYNKFSQKVAQKDSSVQELNKEYENYKSQNSDWLESYGMFHVLSDIHGTDDFHQWDNPVDRNLIKEKKSGEEKAVKRYTQVLNRSKDEIEEYKFTQFLLEKQEKEDKEERKKDGIKFIGDLLVGFSYSDEWVYQNAFSQEWKIGAEYGGPVNSPQIWNNPLPDPDKLFTPDGGLGESGKLLYNKVKNATKNVENIRIDNVMGLVDPYIYKKDTVRKIPVYDKEKGITVNIADRGMLQGGNLSSIDTVDKNDNYRKILHNIVLPALKENDINPQEVVWENLGEQSSVFKDVFEKEENLPGIILTTGGRAEELCYKYVPEKDEETGKVKRNKKGQEIWKKVPKKEWSMIGSHDNVPTAKYLGQDWVYRNDGGGYGWQSSYLGGYLNPDPEKVEEKNRVVSQIENQPAERLKAKYAELMRGTENIQIHFPDLLGIDKVYNTRDNSKNCWKLRINQDYEKTYHKDLEKENTYAINMPEILSMAVNAKAGMKVATGENSKENAYSEIDGLQKKLEHWTNVLKEKE